MHARPLVVETGAFALQGALQALRILEGVGESQERTYPVRVVGTLLDCSQRFARELLIALHARFGRALFDTVIRTSVAPRGPGHGLPSTPSIQRAAQRRLYAPPPRSWPTVQPRRTSPTPSRSAPHSAASAPAT